jgi:hypothetical protein
MTSRVKPPRKKTKRPYSHSVETFRKGKLTLTGLMSKWLLTRPSNDAVKIN